MNDIEQFDEMEPEDTSSVEISALEKRKIPKAEKIKAERIREVNSKENSITFLFTIISTALSILNTLNIGPFETFHQTGGYLIISLGFPLVLIILFKHLYIRIISIFFLLWASVLIYKYLFNDSDIEILIIVGALAFSVYFAVGFTLKYLAKIAVFFQSSLDKKYRRFTSAFLILLLISGFSYYIVNRPFQARVKTFVNQNMDKVKYWVISNHFKKNEKGQSNGYYGENSPLKYRDSIYIHQGIGEDNLPVLRFVINYVGTNKKIKSYSIETDKKTIDILPENLKIEKVFIWFIVTHERDVSPGEIEITKHILNSKEAFVRYNGEDFSYTRPISPGEKKILRDVLNVYQYTFYTYFMIG